MDQVESIRSSLETFHSTHLKYYLTLNTTGVYTVWLRGYAANSAGDSLYLGWENRFGVDFLRLNGDRPGEWDWTSISLSDAGDRARVWVNEPGIYTLHLWPREDGFRFDKLLLTADPTYIPSGLGPAESEIR